MGNSGSSSSNDDWTMDEVVPIGQDASKVCVNLQNVYFSCWEKDRKEQKYWIYDTDANEKYHFGYTDQYQFDCVDLADLGFQAGDTFCVATRYDKDNAYKGAYLCSSYNPGLGMMRFNCGKTSCSYDYFDDAVSGRRDRELESPAIRGDNEVVLQLPSAETRKLESPSKGNDGALQLRGSSATKDDFNDRNLALCGWPDANPSITYIGKDAEEVCVYLSWILNKDCSGENDERIQRYSINDASGSVIFNMETTTNGYVCKDLGDLGFSTGDSFSLTTWYQDEPSNFDTGYGGTYASTYTPGAGMMQFSCGKSSCSYEVY